MVAERDPLGVVNVLIEGLAASGKVRGLCSSLNRY